MVDVHGGSRSNRSRSSSRSSSSNNSNNKGRTKNPPLQKARAGQFPQTRTIRRRVRGNSGPNLHKARVSRFLSFAHRTLQSRPRLVLMLATSSWVPHEKKSLSRAAIMAKRLASSSTILSQHPKDTPKVIPAPAASREPNLRKARALGSSPSKPILSNRIFARHAAGFKNSMSLMMMMMMII